MKRVDKLLAAFVLGLAVSYPLAPSVAQQAPPTPQAGEGTTPSARRDLYEQTLTPSWPGLTRPSFFLGKVLAKNDGPPELGFTRVRAF
jgi:hypothetical protein